MKAKPVRLRASAAADLDTAIAAYRQEGGARTASLFVAALRRGLGQITRHPESGSPRYARLLDIPELRFWPLARFPYLVFYVEREEFVDVWRVLHAHRDIPRSLLD